MTIEQLKEQHRKHLVSDASFENSFAINANVHSKISIDFATELLIKLLREDEVTNKSNVVSLINDINNKKIVCYCGAEIPDGDPYDGYCNDCN